LHRCLSFSPRQDLFAPFTNFKSDLRPRMLADWLRTTVAVGLSSKEIKGYFALKLFRMMEGFFCIVSFLRGT
jgi:hypothetical protein